jgi:hypothetical protein
MGFADRDKPVSPRIKDHRREAPGSGLGYRDRSLARGQPMDRLVLEIDEIGDAAGDRYRPAAIFMHPGTGIERGGKQVLDGPVGAPADDDDPTGLGGTGFGPPQRAAVEASPAEAERAAGDTVRGYG